MSALSPAAADSLAQLVSQCFAPHSNRDDVLEKLTRGVSQYAECPTLLDSHLGPWLSLPIQCIVDAVGLGGSAAHLEEACAVFYVFCKVRGERLVASMLPHDAHLIGPVASFASRLGCDQVGRGWECVYTFLVWLGELVRVPFGLLLQGTETANLLVELGKRHLLSQGKPSEASQLMLSRLLTRPEFQERELPSFVAWAVQVAQNQSEDPFLLPTMHAMIARVFAAGSREALLPLAPLVFPLCRERPGASSLVRKTLVKMAQRVGMVFLPPRIASWRYKRGRRVLFCDDSNSGNQNESEEDRPNDGPRGLAVSREVDFVVHLLLCGLRDRDTIVRWAAAKGIGRISDRLPLAFADLIVETVMDLCSPAEEEHAWHGSCLALAELARRGLLLPPRVNDALPAILEALTYDVKQGTRSVGSQVRDAACYVLWACARAYAPEVLANATAQLAGALLETASLDREINCRRAASAAFQEHVGRIGLIKHGIELVAVTDYFHLGSLSAAYQDVAWKVCQYEDYAPWMLESLLTRKICHWDVHVRVEASLLLGRIAPLFPRDAMMGALSRLRSGCLASQAECRHGSLLGLGRCIVSLAKGDGQSLNGDLDLATIISELEAGRLFRGKGGELVRLAACVLTQCLAESRIPMIHNSQRLKSLLGGRPDSAKSAAKRHKEFLDECLRHSTLSVQEAAAAALKPFCQSYLCELEPHIREAVVSGYAQILLAPEPVVSFTRGAALALGACPRAMFGDASLRFTLEALCRTVMAFPDADTRRLCVLALADVSDLGLISSIDTQPCIAAVLYALRDYACDERGDVGSWIREAACLRLNSFLAAFSWSDAQRDTCVGALLELLAGRLDRPRLLASQALQSILNSARACTHVEDLARIFVTAQEGEPQLTFWDRCVASLVIPIHRRTTLASLCTTAGVRSPDVSSRISLLDALCAKQVDKQFLSGIFQDFSFLLEEKEDRVVPHLLFVTDFLLRNGVFDQLFSDEPAMRSSLLSIRSSTFTILSGTETVSTLCTGMDLLCATLRFPWECISCCLHQIVPFLGHQYPVVRQHTALQLHLQVQVLHHLAPDEAKQDELTALLLMAQQESSPDLSMEISKIFDTADSLMGCE